MLRDLGGACLSPFRFPFAALVSSLLLIAAPLALLVANALVSHLPLFGMTFFDPDGRGDPLLLQHFI